MTANESSSGNTYSDNINNTNQEILQQGVDTQQFIDINDSLNEEVQTMTYKLQNQIIELLDLNKDYRDTLVNINNTNMLLTDVLKKDLTDVFNEKIGELETTLKTNNKKDLTDVFNEKIGELETTLLKNMNDTNQNNILTDVLKKIGELETTLKTNNEKDLTDVFNEKIGELETTLLKKQSGKRKKNNDLHKEEFYIMLTLVIILLIVGIKEL